LQPPPRVPLADVGYGLAAAAAAAAAPAGEWGGEEQEQERRGGGGQSWWPSGVGSERVCTADTHRLM